MNAADLLMPVERLSVELADADLERCAHELIQIRRLQRTLGRVQDEIEDRVAALMPDKRTVIDGIGLLERRRSATRTTWYHDQLFAVVAARGSDERQIDLDTGEALESEAQAVVRAIRECAGLSYWRKGALVARGIDPDQYVESMPGRMKVQVSVPDHSDVPGEAA